MVPPFFLPSGHTTGKMKLETANGPGSVIGYVNGSPMLLQGGKSILCTSGLPAK
ncbi:hypothetical protein [Sporosarcina sp. SAFN-015]|uniref:hypothetical protein n=1 Tax=Sporosarcina sp. SAFN-015 TaxID=3387274 RepID=UPI003F802925